MSSNLKTLSQDYLNKKQLSQESLKLKGKRIALRCVVPILFLILWQILAWWIQKPFLLPKPLQILDSGLSLFKNGTVWSHIGNSLQRVLGGFALGSVLALLLGGWVGANRQLEKMLDPLVQVIRPIPPLAWIPILILWLGIGEASKVVLISLGSFFPVYLSTIHGIRSIDPHLEEVAKTLEIRGWNRFRKLVLPSVLPAVLVGLRTGLGMSWMCVVAAELIAANKGLGFLIENARLLSRADIVIVGMILIGVVGLASDLLLRKIEKRVINWEAQEEEGVK